MGMRRRELRDALTVAGWEFRRYFKWKDQLVGLAVFVLLALLGWGAARVAGAEPAAARVGLAGVELAAPEGRALELVPAPELPEQRRAALEDGELEGVLTRRADGAFELLVTREPRYADDLRALLDGVARAERLAAAGLTAEELARIAAPAELEVVFTDPERGRRGGPEKVLAGLFIGALLLGVLTSMAYLLAGITGEKQLRVTESVVAAVSPQAWIDGKLLGITAYALASLLNVAVGTALLAVVAGGAFDVELPAAAARPGVLLALALFTLLGLLLWNAFFAALAATIEDPNHSSRTSLMLLPVLPVVATFAVLKDPDGALARALAVLPPTSASALPARLVLSDPGPLEVALSAALLVAAIALARRVAGRIFEVGILMYGKEPGWSEVLRWAREPRGPR